MPDSFEPRTEILPKAQQEIWPLLAPAPRLSLVLYGGTAIALHLGHRISVDFDFFRTEPLNRKLSKRLSPSCAMPRRFQEDERHTGCDCADAVRLGEGIIFRWS